MPLVSPLVKLSILLQAQYGLGGNIAQEAYYPLAFTDSQGKSFSGNRSYQIHFNPGQTPPVDAFWSFTMYDNKLLLVDKRINRYSIGTYTEGLKNNTDGSLDIYIQNDSPGSDKESNWLPSANGTFSMVLRMVSTTITSTQRNMAITISAKSGLNISN